MNLRFLFLVGCLFSSMTLNAQKDTSEWLFIYYMPYDNNLSYLAEDIHSMIDNGIDSDKVNAVVQADLDDSLGMTRTIITKNGKTATRLTEEHSSKRKPFSNYLDWVNANFEFEKCAVVFLDHGGGLDEVGLDQYPDSSFLKVTDIRKSLERFNKQRKDTVDLVFYQVCTKSSIEPLYELSKVTKYTMASQLLLGAPNRYYTNLFQAMGTMDDLEGDDIAHLIANNEAIDMYSMYTCVDNSAIEALREDFINYIKAIDKRMNFGFSADPISIEYAGERYWDLESFVMNINSTRASEIELQQELVDTLNDELIILLKKNQHIAVQEDYCGVSISALSKAKIKQYRKLKFYRKFKIRRLDLL